MCRVICKKCDATITISTCRSNSSVTGGLCDFCVEHEVTDAVEAFDENHEPPDKNEGRD